MVKQDVHQFLDPPGYIRPTQIGAQQTDAAINVIAHPAGRNHPLGQIKSCHPTDGKAVTPMNVRHGQGSSHYTGQHGHIGYLL